MKNCAICENSEDVKMINGKPLCIRCRKDIATGYFIYKKEKQKFISAYSSGIIFAVLACVIRLIILYRVKEINMKTSKYNDKYYSVKE